jgi:hypothetical protein
MCPETICELWLKEYIYNKYSECPFMRFNAHLDTSHHGPRNPFKDAVEVADTLTGIHNAMSVVNRSRI